MPAYRSPAEAEIRDAVVDRIRQRRPKARVIHEINVSAYSTRIDLVAVSRAEIIAVEIKSSKDKLDRLPAQMAAMKAISHHAVAAIHEKFLVEQVTNKFAAHYERDGEFYLKTLPPGLNSAEVWVYPEVRRCKADAKYDPVGRWYFPEQRLEMASPDAALFLLWRDELYALCGELRVAVGRRATAKDMRRALRWFCTGRELTLGICAALRARRCAEADPEMAERVAA